MGRLSMSQLTLQQRISRAILRNPFTPDGRVAKNVGCVVAEVRQVRSELLLSGELAGSVDVTVKPESSSMIPGVPLNGKTVTQRRPVDSPAKFIKRLEQDKGFEPRILARAWGVSEESVKRYAKELGCLKYVEVREDEWVAMVLNPVTAAKYQ